MAIGAWHASLQGAAWLQSQATLAAAQSAFTDLPKTSAAAAASACTTSTPLPASLGKHCRHASSSPFTLPDQEDSTSPLHKDPFSTAPAPAPAPARGMTASPSHSKAPQPSAASIAASTSGSDTCARSAYMTGQESLQKATIALQSLQRKYGQAGFTPKSSSSSSSGFLGVSQQAASAGGRAADTEVAAEAAAAPSSSRSSFEFCAAVGLRGATRLPERAHSSTAEEGPHPSRLSRGAHSSSSADESSHEGSCQ